MEDLEQKLEQVSEESDEHLEKLEVSFEGLMQSVEDYSLCVHNVSIKELDSKYKECKDAAKALNKLSKEYYHLVQKEVKENDDSSSVLSEEGV